MPGACRLRPLQFLRFFPLLEKENRFRRTVVILSDRLPGWLSAKSYARLSLCTPQDGQVALRLHIGSLFLDRCSHLALRGSTPVFQDWRNRKEWNRSPLALPDQTMNSRKSDTICGTPRLDFLLPCARTVRAALD